MRGRILAICTIVGAVVLFSWQTISNVVLPWHSATMTTFATTPAEMETIRALAPEPGVYVSQYGVFAAVSFTPDMADKTGMLPLMLGRQLVLDLAAVFVLCLLAGRLRDDTPLRVATAFGLAAFAVMIVKDLSDWNWYGFPLPYAAVNTMDNVIGFMLTGAVVAALARKLDRTPDTTAERVSAPGTAYRTPGPGARV